MRLKYSIGFEDFKSLQPTFEGRAGENAGFKGVLVACGLISLLGVFLLINGAVLAVGFFLIGLGMVAATSAYFYEQRSVAAKEKIHKKKLEVAFQEIHCREQRLFEANENGFTASCNCGTITRPWSELTSFSENNTHFAFSTKMGGQILPKSAFSSEAEITEFRALESGKVGNDKFSSSPYVDFALSRKDYRDAAKLHNLKGGGWRRLTRVVAIAAVSTWGCVVTWKYVSASRDPIVLVGLVALLVAAPAYGKLKRKVSNKYFGSLRTYFNEDGLQTQYPAAQTRKSWSQFIGYLEDSEVFLVYLNPKFFSIVPKRALGGQCERFQALLKTKLGQYDYRNPAVSTGKVSGPVQAS